jgi:hypothetical protein
MGLTFGIKLEGLEEKLFVIKYAEEDRESWRVVKLSESNEVSVSED